MRWSDEDQVFVGSIPGLVGECCHGDTPEQVIPQLRDIAATNPHSVREALRSA